MPLTYVSLCDGIGAVHVAWQPLGWRCAWVAEIDPFANAVVARRWGFANRGDLRRLDPGSNRDDDRPIDLVVGGTPCQSFSLAGRRRGLHDPRGHLALVYLDVVGRILPRWVLWENVPGVLSSAGGGDFGTFIGSLDKLGYGLAWRVLDAQFFGVPQRRRRVFVVAYHGDWRPAAAVLLEPQSLRGNPPPGTAPGKNASVASAGGIGTARSSGGDRPEQLNERNCWCMAHGQGNAEIALDRSPTLSCNHEAPILAFQPRIGRSGRGVPSPLVPTLTGSDAGATSDARPCLIAGTRLRRLTPRECERLQGFPDDYTLVPLSRRQRRRIDLVEAAYLRRTDPTLSDEQIRHLSSDGPRYRALGNAMAVPVMAWLGRRIDRVDRMMRETVKRNTGEKAPVAEAAGADAEGR